MDNNTNRYMCILCKYVTHDKSNASRHLKSKKHHKQQTFYDYDSVIGGKTEEDRQRNFNEYINKINIEYDLKHTKKE